MGIYSINLEAEANIDCHQLMNIIGVMFEVEQLGEKNEKEG